jgi:tRNA(Ile)-lysidine synthase
MRYACFREEVGGENGGLLLLAHHAEDQAETVLFRLLRGTGPRGLAGIPQARPLTPGSRGWLVRPLLGVSGVELAGWVLQHRLRPKEDPTNVDLAYRRNWLRHRVLPHLGSDVRADLLALAQAAREREEVLDRILAPVADAVVLDSLPDGRLTVDRRRLNLYPPPVRAELLRSLIRTQGGRISRRGMAMALEFLASPRGSGRLTAGPGLLLVREGKKGHIQCIAGAVQDDRS